MNDSKPTTTPLVLGIKLSINSVNDKEGKSAFPFRELIGALMYIAIGTRPDIAHSVNMLSQYNNSYERIHWVAAKRVLRYLKGTMDLKLIYKKDDSHLKGYVDSDWGNCTIDRKSFTGSVFIMGGAAISWESKKQRTVALSSTEAEYMALTHASKEAIHLIAFLNQLRLPKFASVELFNDNQSAGKLAVNPVFHSRSKHIDIKHHFIRETLNNHPIKLVYLSTDLMIADVLTKPLPGPKHYFCVKGLGLM
ncbi:secreted RxLR effector protein 161-like [Leptopilina heterotoma]|uniref:secreted RxLR effector protein 161-like n=1 Tax=Leptopilina heterotoma TaxID=63436 RepID=UPI001CA974A0|nr:secreted RxLR effector protein 161-like [Leptopilina heterotoma]